MNFRGVPRVLHPIPERLVLQFITWWVLKELCNWETIYQGLHKPVYQNVSFLIRASSFHSQHLAKVKRCLGRLTHHVQPPPSRKEP